MKKFTANIMAIAVVVSAGFGLVRPFFVYAATTPLLGATATFGVLASTYTNTTAGTVINGDVGFTTGPAVAPGGTHSNYGSGTPYSSAGSNQSTVLIALNSQSCDFNFGAATDLSLLPQPLAPGVYCIVGAVSVGTAGITLHGSGTYIFRSLGALNSVAGSMVSLAGGASECNIFWTPIGATTLAANTVFVGTVIDDAAITVGANTLWSGRAWSFNGTVTTDTDTITAPTCVVPTATLHVVKQVMSSSGSTASASSFNLHVKISGLDVTGSPALGSSTPGISYILFPGTYVVSEDASSSYTQSFSGDCDVNGSVTLATSTEKICTVINTENVPLTAPSPMVFVPSGPSFTPSVPVSTPVILSPSTTVSAITAAALGAVVMVPSISIVKTPSRLTPFPFGGGDVTYAYDVKNPGTVPIRDVVVTDDMCAPVLSVSGDTNGNNLLDSVETWTYSCTVNVPVSTTNVATVEGLSGVSTVIDHAFATVVVSPPLFPNTGFAPSEPKNMFRDYTILSAVLAVSFSFYVVQKKL